MQEMTFGEAIKTCFRKYATFTGRARRAEFWYFYLFIFLVNIGISMLSGLIACIFWLKSGSLTVMPVAATNVTYGLLAVSWLVFLLPQYAAFTRRLHDTGKSGWWLVAFLVLEVVYIVSVLSTVGAGLLDWAPSATPSSYITALPIVTLVLLVLLLIFSILLLVWFCMDSHPASNKYGPNPKAPSAEPSDEPLVDTES